MKDKKKTTAALVSIISALRKGYDILNANLELPDVDNETLPVLAPHIIKSLNASIIEIEENARFEGMTYEEIVEKREAEKQEAISRNLEAAAESLRAMKFVADPEVDEFDKLEHTEEGLADNPIDDQDSEDDGLSQTYTLDEALAERNQTEADLKDLDPDSEQFFLKQNEIRIMDLLILKIREELKAK